jgi:amidase
LKLLEASIESLQREMAAGRASARSLAEAYLARIDAYDAQGPCLNAVTQKSPDALADADALDAERAQGRLRGRLHGIPILVKDNMDVAGMATTGGSKALEGLVADRDAFVIARLRAAGAVLLGKTNLHELAAGITTVGSAAGRTRNPYDLERNPGGSSGGTGAAVAANLAVFGTSSDTCGSTRIPAAQNALVGLRPTQGLTSLSGILPLCARQDVVGPLARSVSDLAIGLDVMVGIDPSDPGTRSAEGKIPEFAKGLESASLAGRRIGRLDTLFGSEEDEPVASIVRDALARLEAAGAEIVPIALPSLTDLLDFGFFAILGDLPGDLENYLAACPSAPVKSLADLIATGLVHPEVAPVLQAAVDNGFKGTPPYEAAIANRERIRMLLEGAMREYRVEALAYPPILRVAARLGEAQEGSNANAAADSGLPAISLPAGFDADGHPVGLELLGSAYRDGELVALAAAIEARLDARRAPECAPEL